MGFEPTDCTFYIDGKPIKVVAVDMAKVSSEENCNEVPMKLDMTKEATLSAEIKYMDDEFMKTIGFNWWQRALLRIRWIFRRCVDWIRKLFS